MYSRQWLGQFIGLTREGLALRLDEEHVLPVVLPVARLLPQLRPGDPRRRHLLVAPGLLQLPGEVFQRPVEACALGVPEGEARRLLVEA